MVKAEIGWNSPRFEDADAFGVVASFRVASGGGQENDADSMLAKITGGIGIDVKLFYEGYFEVGFFLRFPDSSRFHRFAVVYEAAG